MNKVFEIGYIGKKGVSLKFAAGTGNAVGTFSLSVPKDFKKGEEKREYNFFNVVCFKGTAEFIANNETKIKRILVEGSLQSRSYDNKAGVKVYVTEIVANKVDVIEWNNDEASAPNNPSKGEFSPGGYGDEVTPVNDDDIPFK